MWAKICANTSLEDTLLAVTSGADAVGFIFAESVRRMTPAQVRAITPHLPASVEKYGVFVDSSLDQILATVEESGLTGVQLHSSQDPALPAKLRERYSGPHRLGILKVIHYGPDLETQLRNVRLDSAIDAVLVDSRTASLLGGSGQRFDWQTARSRFAETASRLRLIAAGGLNPQNVAEAIETLRPWGVDVASGVETSPGKKDPARVKAFIENARIAAHKSKLETAVEA
jgi:phosphoribosylanthranilate isomerase